jgi:hypothetical protein
VTETVTTSGEAGAPAAGSGVAELGLTVTIGMPVVTRDLTVKPAANTDWVTTGPPSPAWTSTASVMTPEPSLTARRPAISLPSAEDGMSTAAGEACSTTAASASTFGTTR